MRNKIFYVLLVFAGVLLCLLMAYRNSVQKDLLVAKDITIDNLTNANVTLAPLFEANITNCGKTIDDTKIILKDTAGQTVKLKNLIKKQHSISLPLFRPLLR